MSSTQNYPRISMALDQEIFNLKPDQIVSPSLYSTWFTILPKFHCFAYRLPERLHQVFLPTICRKTPKTWSWAQFFQLRKSYLEQRSQAVEVSDRTSGELPVLRRFPQGLFLGPLFPLLPYPHKRLVGDHNINQFRLCR